VPWGAVARADSPRKRQLGRPAPSGHPPISDHFDDAPVLVSCPQYSRRMEKSARLIGMALGKTAAETNALLREHGYLEGSPGEYSLTDKGKEYGSEKYHHLGNGGYAHYNRDWTTRTWDERIVTALAADMTDRAHRVEAADRDHPATKASTEPVGESEQKDEIERPAWVGVALAGGAAVALAGGVVVATNPRVHRWVGENVTPRAQKVWRTLTGRGPGEIAADHDGDAPSGVVELTEATAKD